MGKKKGEVTDKELRRLIKSLRKFATPLDRLDLIKVDSNLTHIANDKLKGHICDILSKLQQQFNDNLRLKDKRKNKKDNDKINEEVKKEEETQADNEVQHKIRIGTAVDVSV